MTTPETPLPVALPEAVIEAAARAMFERHCGNDLSKYTNDDHKEMAWRTLRGVYVADATVALAAAEALRGREVPEADWQLVAVEKRPKPEAARIEVIHRGNAFVNANVAVECEYETLYRWKAVIGFVGTSDKPPRARVITDAALDAAMAGEK